MYATNVVHIMYTDLMLLVTVVHVVLTYAPRRMVIKKNKTLLSLQNVTWLQNQNNNSCYFLHIRTKYTQSTSTG